MATDPEYVDTAEPLDADEALRRVEDAELAPEDDALDLDAPLDDADILAVEDERPSPPAKSYAYDFARRRFLRAGRGGLPTRGMDTLTTRLTKMLIQPKDAAPVAPDGYGMEDPDAEFGVQTDDAGALGLEGRVEEALSFDPLVASVEDFEMDVDPGSDTALVSFTVELTPTEDADVEIPSELTIEGVRVPIA